MTRLALRRPRRRWAAALAAAVLATPLPGIAHAQFSSLVVFGDSFSDPGNAYQLTAGLPGGPQPPSPPYYLGRLSDGPIWVDYFATRMGIPAGATPAFLARTPSGSYAVATARTVPPAVPGPLVAPSTGQQLLNYLTRPGAGPAPVNPTGLYVLFAGANDVADAAMLPTDAARIAAAQAAAANLGAQAGQLAALGAGNVLIPFLPGLGFTPQALAVPGLSPGLNALTDVFNAALAGQLATLRSTFTGTTFYELSLDNLFANILADAATGGTRFGLTNAAVPCLPGIAPAGAPPCAVSVFADAQHPTSAAHELIADAMYDRVVLGVDVQVVPEPSTIALVGGGLLLLGAGAARRRKQAA